MTWRGVRTVMVLELRQRVRTSRRYIGLAIVGLLCSGLLSTVPVLASCGYIEDSPAITYRILYDLSFCFVLGIGLIITPILSATSINGDRADATLAPLLATALRSQEIVVGKLLAAWVAAIAFLSVAGPSLLMLTVAGDSHWLVLITHLVILTFTLGTVCAIGLGFSSLTVRPRTSTVLTYIAVAALTVGTPLATAMASPMVTGTQTQVTYYMKSSDDNDKVVCQPSPEISTQEVTHTDRIWWMLVPNPFAALGDATAHAPTPDLFGQSSLLKETGLDIDTMRDTQPEVTIHNACKEKDDSDNSPLIIDDFPSSSAKTTHPPFWPVSLVTLTALGAGGVITASKRLRVPAGRLPRGTRLA